MRESNPFNSNGRCGTSYVMLDDMSSITGHDCTISSSSIAVQGGPTIDLGSGVAGVTIDDAFMANSYIVKSVLATDPVTINGDTLDVVTGPAAGPVTNSNHAHSGSRGGRRLDWWHRRRWRR
jgi:hypothetical protein